MILAGALLPFEVSSPELCAVGTDRHKVTPLPPPARDRSPVDNGAQEFRVKLQD